MSSHFGYHAAGLWPCRRSEPSLRTPSPSTWRLRSSAAGRRRPLTRSRRRCRRGRRCSRRCGRFRLLARAGRPSRRDRVLPAGPISSRAQGRGGHPLLLCRPPGKRQRRVTLYRPRPERQRARTPPAPCEVSTRRAARPAARGLELGGAAARAPAVSQRHGGAGGGKGQGHVRPREPLPGLPGAGASPGQCRDDPRAFAADARGDAAEGLGTATARLAPALPGPGPGRRVRPGAGPAGPHSDRVSVNASVGPAKGSPWTLRRTGVSQPGCWRAGPRRDHWGRAHG